MESPIPTYVNKAVFNTILGSLALAVSFSLLRERWAVQSRLSPEFKALGKAKSPEERLASWKAVQTRILEDSRMKKTGYKVALAKHIKPLRDALERIDESSGVEIAEVCLKIIQLGFAGDEEGRVAFNKGDGCRSVLNVLAKAHKEGHRRLMEEAAKTLEMLTVVDDSLVILPDDIPRGSEGAYSVATRPATINMLRTLDPSGNVAFITHITGIFVNLTTLREGAKAIYKGTDGTTGLGFFLRLLSHHNRTVVENSSRAVSNFIRAGLGHDEICQVENLALITGLISLNSDARAVNAALTVIVIMLDSPYLDAFVSNMENSTNGLQSLFNVWTRHTDKTCRQRAEVLVRLLERLTKASDTIKKLIVMNRASIEERRSQDEAEAARQRQQQQQQQMMQQMMMQRMAGGDMGAMAAMMGGE